MPQLPATVNFARAVSDMRDAGSLDLETYTRLCAHASLVSRERDTLQTAFDERTEALTRSADECMALAAERDALRDALRGLLEEGHGPQRANARRVLANTIKNALSRTATN